MKLREILNPNLILVEGNDDQNFLEALLIHEHQQPIEFINCNGKSNFDPFIDGARRLPGFFRVRKFGLIRDADSDFKGSFASLVASLTRVGLVPPADTHNLSAGTPQTGIFLMPSHNKNGMLEDICLESVESAPASKCVELMWPCVSALPQPPLNPSKSRAHAYMAAMPESVPHVGIAAKKAYWNLSSPALNDLRTFLKLFT